MINTTQNDVMGNELALDHLADKANTAALEALRRNGPPPIAAKTWQANTTPIWMS